MAEGAGAGDGGQSGRDGKCSAPTLDANSNDEPSQPLFRF